MRSQSPYGSVPGVATTHRDDCSHPPWQARDQVVQLFLGNGFPFFLQCTEQLIQILTATLLDSSTKNVPDVFYRVQIS